MAINLKFYSTSGHGYLMAKKSLIEKAGIAEQISSYSYISGDSVYLEEDHDAIILLNKLKELGIEYNLTDHYASASLEEHFKRDSYSPLIFRKTQVGDIFVSVQRFWPFIVKHYKVSRVYPGEFIIECDGREYRLPKKHLDRVMTEDQSMPLIKIIKQFDQILQDHQGAVTFNYDQAMINNDINEKPVLSGVTIDKRWRLYIRENGPEIHSTNHLCEINFKGDGEVNEFFKNIKHYSQEADKATSVSDIVRSKMPRVKQVETHGLLILYVNEGLKKGSTEHDMERAFAMTESLAREVEEDLRKFDKKNIVEAGYDDANILCIKIFK